MFGLFKKEPMKFPELKTGDWIYFKEEDYWEDPARKTGFSRYVAGTNIFFRTDKPYRVCYVSSSPESFFIEADSLVLYLTTRNCIERIAEKDK